MKQLSGRRLFILCWLPFALALIDSYIVLNAATGMMPWEPAFYSFYPMTFFFVGFALYSTQRELRDIRDELVALRTTRIAEHAAA